MIELLWQQVEEPGFQLPYYFNQAAYMGNLEAVRFFFSVWSEGDEDYPLMYDAFIALSAVCRVREPKR
jgi:hypothetical protein